MKTKIEIKNRWTGKIIFEFETESNTVAKTVSEYVRQAGANLRGANLLGADLRDADLLGANLRDADLLGANLRGADLRDANLIDADLRGANLRGADLRDANLRGADLRDADLRGANFRDAYLSSTDLRGADLRDANLRGADLRDADLRDADLSQIKYDFFGRMLMQQNEIPALREKLIAGEVDGSSYEDDCCCFVGTIAKARNEHYRNLDLKPDSGSATEKWFLSIRPGDTPENSAVVKQTVCWIDEFLSLVAEKEIVD